MIGSLFMIFFYVCQSVEPADCSDETCASTMTDETPVKLASVLQTKSNVSVDKWWWSPPRRRAPPPRRRRWWLTRAWPEPTVSVPAVTLCWMASAVYDMRNKNVPEWPPKEADSSVRSLLNEFDIRSKEKGCTKQKGSGALYRPAFCIFLHKSTNTAVIAVKGTDPDHSGDVWHDITSIIFWGDPVWSSHQIVRHARHLQDKHQEVLVTGHSLGGFLAEVGATKANLGGLGFQAPGPRTKNGKYDPALFRALNAWEDNIGNAYWHKREKIYMGLPLLQTHSVIQMCKSLESMPHITNGNIGQEAHTFHGYLALR